jgi:hypothetical protein
MKYQIKNIIIQEVFRQLNNIYEINCQNIVMLFKSKWIY